MRDTYLLNRETITSRGLEFTISTHAADMTAWHRMYTKGYRPAHYPLPAIPLQVVFPPDGYIGVIYIDDVSDPEDPIMLCLWDFYDGMDGQYTVTGVRRHAT